MTHSGPPVGPPVADLAVAELDELFVIFNPATNRVSTLNQTASQIWRLAGGEHTEDELVVLLAGMYGVAPESIGADVRAAVANLRDEGLLSQDDTG